MDRLADDLLRAALRVADRFGNDEMLDLRIGKRLVDLIDRPARDAGLVEPFDPISVRMLADDLVQMCV